MALSASTVLEVRTTGSDTNGGGFVAGASGTDWSQQNGPQYAVTDGVTNGTTTVTSASANFGPDVVGNLVYIAGGTGSVAGAWYQIAARTSATTIVVDRSTGLTAGTGAALNIGGALASPGQAAVIMVGVAGVTAFVKYSATPFAIASVTANVSGGCVTPVNNTLWQGYNTTRSIGNTDALRPTFQIAPGVSSAVIFNGSATPAINNLILDGNLQTSSRGATGGMFTNCTFKNFTNLACATSAVPIACLITGCTTSSGAVSTPAYFCEATGNSITPFLGSAVGCLSYGNTGASTDGFAPVQGSVNVNCVAYNNGRHGFNGTGVSATFASCISEGNAGAGYNAAGGDRTYLFNCASYGNSSGRVPSVTPAVVDVSPIVGGGTFFTNAAGGVFTLNALANQGALARGVGFPGTFPTGLTVTYLDAGAAQHQDAGGGGGTRRFGIGFGG